MFPYRNVSTANYIFLIISFLLFCATMYQFNEIIDLPRDRTDKFRAMRPLASGKVSVREILVFASLLSLVSWSIAFFVNPQFIIWYIVLLGLNLLYVTVLKKYPPIDTIGISLTHSIQFILGGLAVASTPIWREFPLFILVIWILMIGLHAEKQLNRLQQHNRLEDMNTLKKQSESQLVGLCIFSIVTAFLLFLYMGNQVPIYMWLFLAYQLICFLLLALPTKARELMHKREQLMTME